MHGVFAVKLLAQAVKFEYTANFSFPGDEEGEAFDKKDDDGDMTLAISHGRA